MEPDFIATIKLVTGEELISKVSYMPDDDSLVLDSPMEVTRVDQTKKNVRIAGFALGEWIHSTFDQMFVLPKQHVLTMTEVEDKNIQNFYTQSVERHATELNAFKEAQNPHQFTRNMGHLGSVQATKQSLEELYKRS
jgi:hypothetical protein|tara:strand:+ start:908 stop:1318 length:411 start_codon:yes stop_codon:yes gene_type:complete